MPCLLHENIKELILGPLVPFYILACNIYFVLEYAKETPDRTVIKSQLDKIRADTDGMLSVAQSLLITGDDINVNEIGELVEEELNATQLAIQDGAKKIQVFAFFYRN